MKKIIIMGFVILTMGCSNNLERRSLVELNRMTDWNKAEISNKTALEFKNEADMFKKQRNKDIA
ncbi:MAG: hypothetical protein ACRCRT_03855, partial [Cetobacterium somerae]